MSVETAMKLSMTAGVGHKRKPLRKPRGEGEEKTGEVSVPEAKSTEAE
jgi:hypothetical protein